MRQQVLPVDAGWSFMIQQSSDGFIVFIQVVMMVPPLDNRNLFGCLSEYLFQLLSFPSWYFSKVIHCIESFTRAVLEVPLVWNRLELLGTCLMNFRTFVLVGGDYAKFELESNKAVVWPELFHTLPWWWGRPCYLTDGRYSEWNAIVWKRDVHPLVIVLISFPKVNVWCVQFMFCTFA